MATVLTIMDEPSFSARTDVIVVVDADRELATWVPRDLWSDIAQDRINVAYKRGGHSRLAEALAGHGLNTEHGLCLSRAAVEGGIGGLQVAMPVERRLSFWYPRVPGGRIEDGRKVITFEPPVERLEGERVHAWIGARYSTGEGDGGDLARIRRQQLFIAVLIGEEVDFTRFLGADDERQVTGQGALDELARVRADWRFETLGPLRRAVVDGAQVLTVDEPAPRR